ncbi:sesquipedalian-1-like [Diretmus argenteus]
MKIHEKIVTHFQSCNSPVDKEGFLYKKGERHTSYQKRWFVLKGNLLFYKDRPADRELTGVIVLEGCIVQLCESDEQFAFSLVWNEPGLRTYKLAAEDQEEQESWIKVLLSANHNYLALLVMDLEKQYREATKAFPGDQARTSSPMPHHGADPPAWLITNTSILSPQYVGQVVRGQPPTFSSSQMLQALPVSNKPASKRSPKPRTKKNANVALVNGPAAPWGECSPEATPNEDFIKLHEDFGKEVKELIADWLKRGRGNEVEQQEDLIDLG